MSELPELELGIRRHGEAHAVELRYRFPGDAAEQRQNPDPPIQVRFPITQLRTTLDPVQHGKLLTQHLFADERLRRAFNMAEAQATALTNRPQHGMANAPTPLRLRLNIAPSAAELWELRWELLCHPDHPDRQLLSSTRILFSRYLSSLDWLPVRMRPNSQLRVLVVVANPSNLRKLYGGTLAPIDAKRELAAIRDTALQARIVVLDSRGQATLDELKRQLNDGFDVLYLICHGNYDEASKQTELILENADGTASVVAGSELVARLQSVQCRPLLVILGACQSASQGPLSAGSGNLTALGPRLAEAGIPAILAMNGHISSEALGQFMPTFFTDLLDDGRLDHAVAVARDCIQDPDQRWRPVLMMRLGDGRLWYERVHPFTSLAGPVGSPTEHLDPTDVWGMMVSALKGDAGCTAILGPGLTESLFGTRRDLAERLLADRRSLPSLPSGDPLTRALQHLAVDMGWGRAKDLLDEHLRSLLKRRYATEIKAKKAKSLSDIISAVGQCGYDALNGQIYPYKLLAQLPIKVFVVADFHNLMSDALRAAGKTPVESYCDWQEGRDGHKPTDQKPTPEPTEEAPLVFHLFGRWDQPSSLVLTEDDHFRFLIGIHKRLGAIPIQVSSALCSSYLMFLGYQLEDWNFRILLQCIYSLGGCDLRGNFEHYSVQIDPAHERLGGAVAIRQYLHVYFQNFFRRINIYWGTSEEFLQQLHAHYLAQSAER